MPFGPRGGERAGVRVKADNGTSFDWDELVWKACAVQAPFIRAGASTPGIGIYPVRPEPGYPFLLLVGVRIAACITRLPLPRTGQAPTSRGRRRVGGPGAEAQVDVVAGAGLANGDITRRR